MAVGEMTALRRPSAGIALAIISGVVVSFFSFYFRPSTDVFWYEISGGTLYWFQTLLGVTCSVFMIVAAAAMYRTPGATASWAKAVIAVSLVSLLSNSVGGLGVGTFVGLVSGITALKWYVMEASPRSGVSAQ